MPLPQQVIERLSQEPPQTPGWSWGVISFSGGILLFALLVYFGLTFGYEPYLDAQVASLNTQMDVLAKSIPASDQAQVATFYSEVTNVQTALQNHVLFSRFLSWLEKSTEANVYYSNLAFVAGNQITLTGAAKTEADVNQQAAIFEAAPEVQKVSVSSIVLSPTTGLWNFTVSLTMNTAAVLRATSQ